MANIRIKVTPKVLQQLADKAGAAKFYPATQETKEQNYLVGAGFLQRFADAVATHVQDKAAELTPFVTSGYLETPEVRKAFLEEAGPGDVHALAACWPPNQPIAWTNIESIDVDNTRIDPTKVDVVFAGPDAAHTVPMYIGAHKP